MPADRFHFKSPLLTVSNVKTMKGTKHGYLTFIQHFAPAKLSGREVCPSRSAGCTAACLNLAGRGKFSTIQAARRRRTLLYFNERAQYTQLLQHELERAHVFAAKQGLKACIRLNGTSDIPWETEEPALFRHFHDTQFYDYTKIASRIGHTPPNYDLTFSASEDNLAVCEQLLRSRAARVAVVFTQLPSRWLDAEVINGDETDLRFLEQRGIIVGLTVKQLVGSAGRRRLRAAAKSGFIIDPDRLDLFENPPGDPMDDWTGSQVIFDAAKELVYV